MMVTDAETIFNYALLFHEICNFKLFICEVLDKRTALTDANTDANDKTENKS